VADVEADIGGWKVGGGGGGRRCFVGGCIGVGCANRDWLPEVLHNCHSPPLLSSAGVTQLSLSASTEQCKCYTIVTLRLY
jgi:hypothetical protein